MGTLTFLLRFAWRNLWRNKRRTWLTVGGIAFAVWFLIFARSTQVSTFDLMIDNTARILPGHVQMQLPEYQDDPRVDLTFNAAAAKIEFSKQPGIKHVSARTLGFALVSVGERSFGAQVIGVEPKVEGQWSALGAAVKEGRYLENAGEVLVGSLLAKNLKLQVGDELVLLGSAKEGGVAAFAGRLVGVFEVGAQELNRRVVQIHIDDFRSAWAFGPDEANALVGIASSVRASDLAASKLAGNAQVLKDGLRVLNWQALMPESEQMRTMKIVGTDIFFMVLAIIVGFSVVNTFMMMVYERTREFGLMMAIGMRPHLLQIQLHIEALFLSVLGIGIGLLLAASIIAAVGESGIPIPVEQAEELLKQFNMSARLYPSFDWTALKIACAIMCPGVQLAAFIPSIRLYRLRPVEAIRQET